MWSIKTVDNSICLQHRILHCCGSNLIKIVKVFVEIDVQEKQNSISLILTNGHSHRTDFAPTITNIYHSTEYILITMICKSDFIS